MYWAAIKRNLLRLDWLQLVSMLTLMVIGVLFIYSAAYRGDGAPVSPYYQKQLVWITAGLGLFLLLALVDYHRLGDNAWWLYVGSLMLLVLVLLVGKKISGATRWLSLFGIQIQPSEFAKLAAIVAMARYLSRPGHDTRRFKVFCTTLLIVVVPFLLIAKEPDLGTAAVLVPVTIMMLFVGGASLRTLGILILVMLLFLPVGWFFLGDYQKERLLVFMDPGRDPLGAGWNMIQSEIAVGSGGLMGKGFLKGTQNVLGFLPRTVAPTDFIYSVIAEEMGFVGCLGVLFVYIMMLGACFRSALYARDKFGRLLAVGVTVMLFCHIFVNIAMTVGLMPITGLPLPLISYGGSFMFSITIALGIVQSVFIRRQRR